MSEIFTTIEDDSRDNQLIRLKATFMAIRSRDVMHIPTPFRVCVARTLYWCDDASNQGEQLMNTYFVVHNMKTRGTYGVLWGQAADAGEAIGNTEYTYGDVVAHLPVFPSPSRTTLQCNFARPKRGICLELFLYGSSKLLALSGAVARPDPIIKPRQQSASGTIRVAVSNPQPPPSTRPDSHPVASAASRVQTMSATRPNNSAALVMMALGNMKPEQSFCTKRLDCRCICALPGLFQ
jgi:hypothetical protein